MDLFNSLYVSTFKLYDFEYLKSFFSMFVGGMYGMPPMIDRYGLGLTMGPGTMVCRFFLGICVPCSFSFLPPPLNKFVF